MAYQSKVYRKQGGEELVVASGGTITVEAGGVINDASMLRTVRARVTTASVNAGATILPAINGYKYRMVDCKLIAVGGNAAGATGVQIKADSTILIDAKVAGIAQSVVARAGATNINVLANGASFVAMDNNTAITIIKDGSDLTTATHIDVIFDYVLEANA